MSLDANRPTAVTTTRTRAWLVVATLFLVQVVNYADKSVMSLAAGPIMRELAIPPERYGVIASAFFSLYAATGLAVALLAASRFRPGSILTVLLVLWSVAQLPIAFSSSFTILLVSRIALGMGEGAGAPTALNASHEWFVPAERNLPSAVVMFGSTAGSLVAAPLLSYVIALAGWRAAFLVCSALGIAVLVLWVVLGRPGPYAAPVSAASSPVKSPARGLWRDRTVIGNLLIGFCAYWVVGFMVGWLAPFVSGGLGHDLLAAGWLLAAIYCGHAVLMLGLSYASQRLLRSGRSSRVARGGLMGLCMAGSAVSFVAAAFMADPSARLIAIGLATGLPAVIFPLSAAMLSEVAPEADRNRLVTIVFSLITLAAIASPLVTGLLVARGPDGWASALSVHGCVALLGGILGVLLLDPERSRERLRSAA